MLDSIPDDWGPKFEKNSAGVAHTHIGPSQIEFIAPGHVALVMLTAQSGRRFSLNSDRKISGTAPVGSFEIIPAASELFAEWSVEKENMLVAFSPERLQPLAGMEFDNETFEFRPPDLGHVDRRAYELARWMRFEVENQEFGSVESLDALVTIFGIHLLRNYTSLKSHASGQTNGGLPPVLWRRVNDYIQAHLAEELTLERLAIVTGLSPSHFGRAFKQTCGQSPHQYVISCRLNRARELICNTKLSFNQVATTVGFSSNSHMTAVMKRDLGVTPSMLRWNNKF